MILSVILCYITHSFSIQDDQFISQFANLDLTYLKLDRGAGVETYDSLIQSDNTTTRYFYTYFPVGVTLDNFDSILFNVHSYTAKCEDFKDRTSFKSSADSAGANIIVITPCGSPGTLKWGHYPSWNAGECCNGHADDYDFFQLMINKFKPYNHSMKVFSAGFSNGAFMTEALACHGMLDGAASMSGDLIILPGRTGAFDKCDQLMKNKTKSSLKYFYHIHGTRDLLVPMAGNYALGFGSVWKSIDRWSKRLNCLNKIQYQLSNGIKVSEWPTCDNNGKMKFLTFSGNHRIYVDDGFVACDDILHFFGLL